MEKKRLRTITILFSKKNCNSQITNENETEEKKGNAIFYILNVYKKVDSFNTKNHVIVMF